MKISILHRIEKIVLNCVYIFTTQLCKQQKVGNVLGVKFDYYIILFLRMSNINID